MKRKGEDVLSEFKSDWTDKLVCSELMWKTWLLYMRILCFTCKKNIILSVILLLKHSEINFKYPISSDSRKEFIHRIEGALDTQQSFFTKTNEHSKSIVIASYEITLLLARKKKPFTDAEEIIKPAFNIAARMLGDINCEKIFDQIPLSNNTMTRRV
ncbi:SCAN domain-containing protein 3 [Thelohanellus kitauei]|uniref:SCAN domain-containing protein 3 n=1 Tax=Thelohanellus kitauei TaxID=669202 RepID=A0A0C2JG04_THEKT|nr:SCAN domain-containing protein 3 [Thelohanellus kitauei]